MKDITDYVEQAQVAIMSEYAATCNIRDYLIIQILWRTGIRVDVLLHIRPCDLEHHTSMVRIVKAKGNKQRRIPLAAKTLVQLQAYIDANKIENKAPIFPITQQ